MNNQTDIGIKFENKVVGQDEIKKYADSLKKITTYLNTLNGKAKTLSITSKSVANNFKTTSKAVDQVTNSTKQASKSADDLYQKFKGMFTIGKIIASARAIKSLARGFTSLVAVSANYLENLNLVDVAFHNNTTSADKLTYKLSEMYGLDESWGYRTIGIFKQLSNAMGLAEETGTRLAKTMTLLSIDTASLYNMSVEEASNALQSALAGQTKPVRGRFGADITQTTLQATLDRANIDADIATLSYVEKRLVIVASLLQQTKVAQGDWGRTIESVANQMRIFEEQTSRLARALGNVFLPIIKTVLPYLNGILMVLVELTNFLAKLIGFKEEDFDFNTSTNIDSLNDLYDSIDEVSGGLNEANENAKKLKLSLRSFDKLNNITTPTTSTKDKGGGSGSGIGGAINPDILKLFNEETQKYFDSLDNIEMKANKIRDSIMEWLGFTKQVDKETGKVSWKFDHITGGTVLGAMVIGGTIYRGISSIIGLVKKFVPAKDGAEGFLTATQKTSIAVAGIVGGYVLIKKGIQDSNDLIAGAGGLTMLGGFTLVGKQLEDLGVKFGTLQLSMIGGITAIFTAFYEGYKKVEQARDTFRKANQEYRDELKELLKYTNDNIETQSVLLDDGLKYVETLGTLIDKNGKVIKGEETKAKNIIKLLNERYGTEYKIVDGQLTLNKKVVKSNEQVKQSIEDIIVKKKAEIILQAYEQKYGEWIVKRNELEKDREKRLERIASLEAEYETASKKRKKEILKAIDDNRQGLINTESAILEYDDQIRYYDDLMEASIEGNIEKINVATEKYGVKTERTVDKMAKNMINATNDAFYKITDGIDDVNTKMLKIFGKTYKIKVGADTTSFADSFNKILGDITSITNSIFPIIAKKNLKANGGIYDGKSWRPIPQYAQGTPNSGQLFFANERGAELVAHIGGQTFVANQNQVMGMAKREMSKGNGTEIFNIYLDKDKKLATYTLDELKNMARSNGKPMTIG